MNQKKAVIFDLNGVLIVSPKLSERFNIPSEQFLPVLKEIMAKVRLPNAAPLYSYWKPYFDKWGIDFTEKEFEDFWFGSESENKAVTDIARALRAKGIRLFVLSNNLRERSLYYDEHFSFLKELFERQYYSWETGFIKPDQRAYNLILRENGLESEECIYIDDAEENIRIAKGLGMEGHLYKGVESVQTAVAALLS